MAEEIKIPITLDLNASNAAAEGQKIGRDLSKGIESGVKQIDASKLINVDALAQKLSESLKSAVKGLNLGDELSKAFANIDLSKSGFGDSLKKTIADATKVVAPSSGGVHPSTPHVSSAPDPVDAFSKRVQPILSGLEAVSMMLRGSPITSALQMAGQTVRDISAARQTFGGTSHGGGGGGGPPHDGGGGGGGPPVVPPTSFLRTVGGAALEIGAYVSVVGGITLAAKEAAKVVSELGIEGSKTNTRLHTMADTLQAPLPDVLRLRDEFKLSGVEVDQFQRQFSRLGVTARRELPEIELKIKRSGDVTEESAIKVRDADRLVAKSKDDRLLATDKVLRSEGELAKFEAIGAQLREQQTRGAALGVSGAAVGLQGARIQQAAAGVAQQFAPQEAAQANIAGPLTVKGAKLGVEGARLAADQARYQAFVARGGKDPDWAQSLAVRAADHGEKIAAHNIEQAKLHEQQAKVAEEKRVATDAAGAGPVAQANQAAYAAAQATAQARLHFDQARTSQEGLAISQAHDPLEAERRRLEAGVRQERRDAGATPDRQRQAENAARTARDDQDRGKYNDIPFLQRAITSTLAGKKPEDFDLNRALSHPEALRQALIAQGGGKGLDIYNVARGFVQQQQGFGAPRSDLMGVMQSLIPGRNMMGDQGNDFLSAMLSKRKFTPEQERGFQEEAAHLDSQLAEDKKRIAAKNEFDLAQEKREEKTREAAKPLTTPALKFIDDVNAVTEFGKRKTLDALSTTEGGLQGVGNVYDKFIAPGKSPMEAAALSRVKNIFGSMFGGGPEVPHGEVSPVVPTVPPVPMQAPQGAVSDPLQGAASKIEASSGSIPSAIDAVAEAIRSKAAEISGIQIAPPKTQEGVPGTGGGATATELAGGGQVAGHGSQTSDDIPIMASNNEYMMQDAAVQKYGVPFMDAVNHGKLNFAGGGPIEFDERRDRRKQSLINIGGGGGVNVFDEPRSGTLNLAAGGSINYERDEELKAQLEAIQSGKAFRHPLSRLVSSLFGPSTKSSDVKGSFSAGAMLENVPMPPIRPSGASAQSGSNPGYSDLRVPAKTNAAVLAFANATAVNKFMENGKQIYELTPENVETARRIALGLPDDGSFVRPGTRYHSPLGTPEQLEGTKGGGTGRQMVLPIPGVERFSDAQGKEWYTDRSDQKSATPRSSQPSDSTFRPAGGSLSFALSPDKSEVYLGRTSKGLGAPNFPPGNFGRDEFDKTIKNMGGEVLDYNEYRKYWDSQRPESKEIYNPNLSGGADNEAAPTQGNLPDPHDPGITGYRDAAPEGRDAIDEERRRQGLGAAAGGHISKLMRGFAGGGLIGGSFGSAVASVPGYAGGGAMVQSGTTSNTLSSHQLDLRTDAGDFSARVNEDTLQGINNSSLSRKLTQTGPAPTWW